MALKEGDTKFNVAGEGRSVLGTNLEAGASV